MCSNLALRTLAIVLVVCFLQAEGTGQSWMSLEFAKYGRMGFSSIGASLSDSSQPMVAVSMGGYIFLSTDSAKSFKAVELPIQRSFYGDLKPFIASDSMVYVHSTDIVLPNNQWIVVTTDRGASWQSVVRRDSPYNVANIYLASGTFLAIGVPIDSTFRYMADISTNGGKSWLKDPLVLGLEDPVFGALITETQTQLFGEASNACLYLLDPQGAQESFDGGATWTRSKVMQGTIRYWHLSPSAMISLTASLDKPSQMWRSTDDGESWEKLDSISFINTDTIIDAAHFQLLHSLGDTVFTFRTRGGSVITTTDGGTQWIYRGAISSSGDAELMAFSGTSQGTLVSNNSRTYFIVPQNAEEQLRDIQYPGGVPFPLEDSTVLLVYNNAIAKSMDNGKTWQVLDAELTGYSGDFRRDDPNLQPFECRSLWWDYSGRLTALAQYDWVRDVSGSSISTSFLLDASMDDSSSKWSLSQYEGDINFRKARTISFSNKDRRTNAVQSPWLVQITEGDSARGFNSDVVMFRHDQNESIRFTRKRAHLIKCLANGDLVMFADSLFVSKDSARTWESIHALAFPRDSSGILRRVTVVTESADGVLYAGLSGVVTTLNGDAVNIESGGVWRSLDRGNSWAEVGGFPDHTHVLDAFTDGQGTLFIYATNRTRAIDGNRTNQYVDYMYRVYAVRDGTPKESFSEFIAGPTPPGSRMLLRNPDGAMLCTTLYSGLMITSDGGVRWEKLGGDQLDTVTINDVAIDKSSKIYIGTTKGVMTYDGMTSGSEETENDEDNESRRTTVWTYPTPSSSYMRVRLSNMDLITTPKVRLYVCNLMGEEVLDLTEQATRSLGMSQHEFDVNLGDLIRGTYGVVLLAGRNSWFHKILIVH